MQLAPVLHPKPHWKREAIAIWGYVQRNYFLTKRYFMWELVWLVYSVMNALTIGFIGVGFGETLADTNRITTYLLIGTLIWSYLSMIFDLLSETVSWERWEGTIEYTFMSPASRAAQLIGMGLYAVVYGIVRMIIMLGVISLFFDMSLGEANYLGALGMLAICSISLVGFGMVAAVMPLLSPEKGQQVTSIVTAVLLLVSGIYYEVGVLPGWLQPLAVISPVTYALDGIREMLLDGTSFASQWDNVWPLLIMGAIFPPLGLWLFHAGEMFAKRTGRLKRSG
ncbi:MAG TPA: ABC transporter permease [Thermomicrobiales bacterium]|nr:ABC transporter permease [Thermomicrobiales bacterium]